MYDSATDTVGDLAERGADVMDRVSDAASRLAAQDRG